MILTNEYLGRVAMTNVEHVRAGEVGTWTIIYTAGKYGIDDTGSLRIAWRNPSDWGMPQFDTPDGLGYTTVTTTGSASLRCGIEVFERPFNNSMVITVYDGYLVEGDKISICMGDTTMGSPGIRAQTFCEEEHEFRTLVDPYGSRRYQRLPNDIAFPIYPGDANEIHVVAPAVHDLDTDGSMLIRAVDYYGNIAEGFTDLIRVSLISAAPYTEHSSIELEMTPECGGLLSFAWPEELPEGTYYFRAEGIASGLAALSNAHLVGRAGNKLYFGDMHGQTSFTVGTGSLDRYFTFARDSAAVDFCAWQGNDFQVSSAKWNAVREATSRYNEPGRFITFLGYEWSGLTQNGGDHNVYFFGDSPDFYPNSNWLEAPGAARVEDNAPTLPDLYDKVRDRSDVLIIPHIGGRHADLSYFDPRFTPVIEVHSHHGTFEWFIFEAMRARLKVGFIATSDDHTCRPGMSYPLSKDGKASSFDVASGFTALYAPSLTREDVWNALKARRCYATTFSRIVLDTCIGDAHMGQEVDGAVNGGLRVQACSSSPLDTIELYNWDEKIGHVNLRPKGNKRIRIAWSGVRVKTRKKSTRWDGGLEVNNGRIISAEEYSFDRRDQGILQTTPTSVTWRSNTSGDYDGVILELDYNDATEIVFRTEQTEFSFRPADLGEEIITFPAGGVNLKVEVGLANEDCRDMTEYIDACCVDHTFDQMKRNHKDDGNAYWVRVLQEDGHMAWSSPIFVKGSE